MTAPTPLNIWQQYIKPYIQPLRMMMETFAAANVSGGAYVVTANAVKIFPPRESDIYHCFEWTVTSKDLFRFWTHGGTYHVQQQILYMLRLGYESERPNGMGEFAGAGRHKVSYTGDVEADVHHCHEAFQKALSDGSVGSVYSAGFVMTKLDKLLRRYPKSPWYMKLPSGDHWLGS